MLFPSYLFQSRHNVFYYRFPMPKALHPLGKTTHIKVSLNTYDKRYALQLSKALSYIADYLINKALDSNMRYDEIRQVLKDHFIKLLDAKKATIAETGRLSEQDVLMFESSAKSANDQQMFDLVEEGGATPIDRLIDLYSLPVKPGTQTYNTLQTELQASYRAFCQHVLDFNNTLGEYDLSTSPVVSIPPNKVIAESISLSDLIEEYAKERVRGGNWNPRSEAQFRSNFVLLCMILDPDLKSSTIGMKEARKVKDTLQNVPKNMTVSPATRGLTIEDAIAVPNLERMGVRTINKHLSSFNGLFQWAEENGYLEKNVFNGLNIKQGKAMAKDGARLPYTKEQIELITDTVIHNRNGLIKKGYQKWGVLLGVYTGARLNEIAQLKLEDVKQENGIWCIDINEDTDDQSLKTEASNRVVPIHSKLIELGFLDYVDQLRAEKKERVFYELSYTKNRGYGRNLSRWFNTVFLVKLGLKKKEIVFHSFRHTIVTRLMQVNVAEPIVKSIVGHERSGVTQEVYFSEGYTVEQMKEAIELL